MLPSERVKALLETAESRGFPLRALHPSIEEGAPSPDHASRSFIYEPVEDPTFISPILEVRLDKEAEQMEVRVSVPTYLWPPRAYREGHAIYLSHVLVNAARDLGISYVVGRFF